jgi:FkbM family methyltransferase
VARARVHYVSHEDTGEIYLNELKLTMPQPFANRAGDWLHNHPEDVRELEVFTKLAREADGVMLDAGAHVGAFAVLFCRLCAHDAVAVEPVAESQRMIRRTAELNNVATTRIHIVDMALGNEAGLMELHIDDATGFAQVQGYADSPGKDETTLTVKISTIDALRATLSERIALLKIDVEGFEAEVLEGGRRTIEQDRPLILLELHHAYLAARGINLRDALEKVSDKSYSLMRLNGRTATAAAIARTILARTHLLAVPSERSSACGMMLR